MSYLLATLDADGYKLFHKEAYHPEISKVYSNYTSRNGRLSNVPNNEVVFVGLQYFIKDVLIEEWNNTFFNLTKDDAIKNMKRIVDNYLGFDYDASHFEELHDLGYLPLHIKALPEGVSVPYGVPPITFVNTIDGFQWLSNYIETVFSTENWPIQTSATTAKAYLKNTLASFDRAGLQHDLVPFMVHDFSMRGCFGRHAAAMSGFGHLCSFYGTDTLPAILFAEKYYNADVEKELVGASVPATEHSTATSYIMSLEKELNISKFEAEIEYVKYLFSKVPTGILSHVSDSFDFWKFVSEGLSILKNDIMSRDGKFVVRPDSGDIVKVLTGYKMPSVDYNSHQDAIDDAAYQEEQECVMVNGKIYQSGWINEDDYEITDREITPEEQKGLVECLWDVFGGTLSPNGFNVLDEHIGAIYGDSVTLERQEQIINRLEDKGFAALVVLGVGSYSYQYVTRDTHGSAVKGTWVEKGGVGIDVCKDPATDRSKKSATGKLRVEKIDGKYTLYDQQTETQETLGELQTVFLNGELVMETSLSEIRDRIKESL